MDAIVKLYELPDHQQLISELQKKSIDIRHAMPYEKTTILSWLSENFTQAWADECEIAFNHQPVSCLIALTDGQLLGFAAYECTQKNFFGPIGVSQKHNGKGIGSALLLSALHTMKSMGYAYGIIGGLDENNIVFYEKVIPIQEIVDSTPGIYKNRII